MKSIERALYTLIQSAKLLGLNEKDAINAKMFVDNIEYGLGLEVIVDQMYEHDIEITSEFYNLIEKTAQLMNIPSDRHSCLKELIRSENQIPKPIKDQLSKIIGSL